MNQNSCERSSALVYLIDFLFWLLDIATRCVIWSIDVAVHPVRSTCSACSAIRRGHDWIFEDHENPRQSKIICWTFLVFMIAFMAFLLHRAHLNDLKLIEMYGDQ